MIIAIANDHAGVEYKNDLCEFLQKLGHTVINFGCDQTTSCDYPDYARKVTEAIQNKKADMGVLICGTGIGMSIFANKQKGIRASLCDNLFSAQLTREHNDSNVLCMGARVISKELMCDIAKVYFSTPFSNDERHLRRIRKLEE